MCTHDEEVIDLDTYSYLLGLSNIILDLEEQFGIERNIYISKENGISRGHRDL